MNTNLFDLMIPISLLQGGGLICSYRASSEILGKNFISYSEDNEKESPVIKHFLGDEIRLEPIIEVNIEEKTTTQIVIEFYADPRARKEVNLDEIGQVA